jgi:hypothetical protein
VSHAVQQLIRFLQRDEAFDRTRLAAIEWKYLELLDPDHSATRPVTLRELVKTQPGFFVDLLKAAFRGEGDAPDEVLSERDQLVARQSHRLLDQLSRLPGTRDDKSVDWDFMRNWIDEVRSLTLACGRQGIGDMVLGQYIARASRREGQTWPAPELAKLMEGVGTEELFRGFAHGVLNSRGVVSKGPYAGGDSERRLAEEFRLLAEHARPASPKLAGAFLGLASHYESYARQEDERAQRDRLGR